MQELKRISRKEISNAYLDALGDRYDAIADAQLQADQKVMDKIFNPDWLRTKEHYEKIIQDIIKEHQKVMDATIKKMFEGKEEG